MIIKQKTYESPSEGLHRAVCCDEIDLGLVETKFGAKERLELRWFLEERDSHGRMFLVRKRYNASTHPKSTLYKDLVMWRGRKFTAEEALRFDTKVLIGVQCQLQISHSILDDGRVFANVEAVISPVKGLPPLGIPPDYVREEDRAHKLEPDPFAHEDYSNQGEKEEDDDIPF